MRTKYFFIAAVAATVLASCSSNDFVGDQGPNEVSQNNSGAIDFGGGFKAVTRANHVGADAANLLNNKFYVVAFNGDGSSMSKTFDNYLVEWTTNTAGHTQSNTSDWEYVGKTAPAWSGINGNAQTIKYWDYSKAQYDFIAWSPSTIGVVVGTSPTDDTEVGITAPTAGSYAPTYGLTGTRTALSKCYIADMVTHYKANQTPPQPKFQDEVKLTFRNLACKVRVALYETVPGYSIKDVKFYTDGTTDIATGASATNFNLYTTGSEAYNKFYTKGTYTISFPTKGTSKLSDEDYNKAHVAFAASTSDTKEDFGALTLRGKESNEAPATNYLGRTLPEASYAGTAGDDYYKIMLPNEDGTVLQLRVDYTLLATDGSGEEIKIHNAKAFVPQTYAQWKPNYAYTYIFKISDNTNGWTSQTESDPAGLYPITFDAVVVDSEDHTQSTITTVASPSITTYQAGHDVSKNEYDTSGDIYIQVMNDGTLASNLSASGISSLYSLSSDTWTEADVMDALNMQAYGSTASVVIGRNGLTLTDVSSSASLNTTITSIPLVDKTLTVGGGEAAKFTPTGSTTYAYVYYTGTDKEDTNIYAAVTLTDDSEPSDWTGNYWDNPDGTGSAVTLYVKDKTYYRHYTNLNKVYGVKVIKVQ